jgi:uncharacterized membrane protein
MKKRGRLKTGDRSPMKAITRGVPPWRSPWLLATLIVMVAALFLVFASPKPDEPPDPGGHNDPEDDRPGQVYHDVGIPMADIGTDARWYTYESDTAQVRFFAVLEENGKPHVALDACDICYSRDLGFHQEDDTMQCNSCGKAFEVEGIGSDNVPNTCWPGFVPYSISDGYLLIDTNFLDAKAYMFE